MYNNDDDTEEELHKQDVLVKSKYDCSHKTIVAVADAELALERGIAERSNYHEQLSGSDALEILFALAKLL